MSSQVAFSPSDAFFAALNKRHEAAGRGSDGYGWLEAVPEHLAKSDLALLGKLQHGDSESDTCVLWVETESDCRALVESLWTWLDDAPEPQ